MLVPQLSAVIFDCDGVLVDSERVQTGLLRDMASELSFHLTTAEADDLFRGRRLASCMEAISARINRPLPQGFERQFRRRLSAALEAHLRAVPGCHRLLGSLPVPAAVASNSRMDQVVQELSITGLLPRLQGRIFSAYDLGRWKPEPAVYLAAAAHLHVEPRYCLAVEDSPAGVAAAISAGMSVAIYRPEVPESGQASPGCIGITDLMQVLRILRAGTVGRVGA